VLAIDAALFEAPARRAERAVVDVRRSVADMIACGFGTASIALLTIEKVV
jgi:hypothetical protein